jgi:hypothetical protein
MRSSTSRDSGPLRSFFHLKNVDEGGIAQQHALLGGAQVPVIDDV